MSPFCRKSQSCNALILSAGSLIIDIYHTYWPIPVHLCRTAQMSTFCRSGCLLHPRQLLLLVHLHPTHSTLWTLCRARTPLEAVAVCAGRQAAGTSARSIASALSLSVSPSAFTPSQCALSLTTSISANHCCTNTWNTRNSAYRTNSTNSTPLRVPVRLKGSLQNPPLKVAGTFREAPTSSPNDSTHAYKVPTVPTVQQAPEFVQTLSSRETSAALENKPSLVPRTTPSERKQIDSTSKRNQYMYHFSFLKYRQILLKPHANKIQIFGRKFHFPIPPVPP